MTILTLGDIISLEKGSQIAGMTGIVKFVFEPKESADGGGISQSVIIQDGGKEVFVSIKDPETHGGVISKDMVGKKLYFLAAPGKRGTVGLRRGGDYPKRPRPGQPADPNAKNHYCNLDGDACWSVTDERKLPRQRRQPAPSMTIRTTCQCPSAPLHRSLTLRRSLRSRCPCLSLSSSHERRPFATSRLQPSLPPPKCASPPWSSAIGSASKPPSTPPAPSRTTLESENA